MAAQTLAHRDALRPLSGARPDPNLQATVERELYAWAHSHQAEEEAAFKREDSYPYPVAVCRVEDRDPNEVLHDQYRGTVFG
jgi:hypothetical protein